MRYRYACFPTDLLQDTLDYWGDVGKARLSLRGPLIHQMADGIPKRRNLLPLVNKARGLALQDERGL